MSPQLLQIAECLNEANIREIKIARCLAESLKRIQELEQFKTEAGQQAEEAEKKFNSDLHELAEQLTKAREENSSTVQGLSEQIISERQQFNAELGRVVDQFTKINEQAEINFSRRMDAIVDIPAEIAAIKAELAVPSVQADAPKSFNPRGAYESGEKYQPFDYVSANGSSYIALVENPTQPPSKKSKQWMLVAARGAGGSGGIISASEVVGLGTAAFRDVGQAAGNVLESSLLGPFTLTTSDGYFTNAAGYWDGSDYLIGNNTLYIEGGQWTVDDGVFRSANADSSVDPTVATGWTTEQDHPSGPGIPVTFTFTRIETGIVRFGDLSPFAKTSDLASLNASNLTSGTVALARLPTVTVAKGGTGATTLTANNVLLGNGTSALQVVAPGITGNVLRSNGTTWTSAAIEVGDRYLTSSTTSNTVSNGAKTFTVGTGLAYTPTQDVTIANDAAHHMHAAVTTYDSTTGVLVVDVNSHTGTGTFTAWTVNVGGISSAVIPTGGTAGQVLAKVSSTNYDAVWSTPSVAVGGVTGLGTDVATALAISVGSAGAPVILNGSGGTPSSITLTNATGYPAATTTTAGTVPTLGATITTTGTGAPTAAQLYEAWMGAQRYSIRIRANDTSLLQTAVTGAGAASATGVGRQLTSGATTGVARHAWNNGGINQTGFTFHQVSGKDFRLVPWANRVEVTMRLQITAWAATTSGYLYVFFGVPAQIGTDLGNRGIGFKIDNAKAIKAVAHNGTSLTTSASSLGTAVVSSSAYETYRINSDGAGGVTLYRDGTLLGSITGGPTADGAQNQCGLHVEIGNGGQSLTNTVITGDMTISVAPIGF
jgi:hypothetical protein